MTNKVKKLLALAIAAVLVLAVAVPAFTASPFNDNAYASILTGSDFQDTCTAAYDRFGRFLTAMKNDGLETPDSMLVGGDYTKVLFDYAVPGEAQIKDQLTAVYPDADQDRVICIQGNHDNPSSGFAKTGFYDMGVYCLYVINEDDFPWLQGMRPGVGECIKKLAADIKEKLDGMISSGDMRPVLVMTHLPLHHTDRAMYADNLYASYLFNVLNEAGKTLDIVFLFGHQHSGNYDDYIGGSVNFMGPGETIRVPRPDTAGENAYTNETLNFTYTNCGYTGYSNNSDTETSTSALTLGVVRISDKSIRVVKYTENGVFRSNDIERKNPGAGKENAAGGSASKLSERFWQAEAKVFRWVFDLFKKIASLLSFK